MQEITEAEGNKHIAGKSCAKFKVDHHLQIKFSIASSWRCLDFSRPDVEVQQKMSETCLKNLANNEAE
jgi:hypothetical protein